MSQETLVLGNNAMPSVKIHPTVIFEILNSFSRRDDRQNRVVGTLLGYCKDNVFEITECYVIPHHEKVDEIFVAINKDYHKNMLNFRHKINKREQVIGWFSTTSSSKPEYVSDNCSLIHEFYSNECAKSPVHVVVDTALPADAAHMAVKAYMSKPLTVGAHVLGNVFQELSLTVDLTSNEAEVLCLYQMIHGQKKGTSSGSQKQLWEGTTTYATVSDAQESFKAATTTLLQTIDKAAALVGAEDAQNTPLSPQVAAALADAMDVLHSVKKSDFDATFQKKTDTLLMISYITALTKTQLVVAEKLNAIL